MTDSTREKAFTPGPWEADGGWRIRSNALTNGCMCVVHSGAEDLALILAAPDLLAALEAMVETHWHPETAGQRKARKAAEIAIRQARGEGA
jgi:predicted secreted Zn-dependent protease